ncbi:hypothetical protein VTN02DRAFT_2312 [Thermoascus thermophilus]
MGLPRPSRPARSTTSPLRSPSPPPPLSRPKIPPKPPTPQAWTWTCHLCGDRYRLGVTRRCLGDGHYFCAGQQPAAAGGPLTLRGHRTKSKRKRSCDAEFDYHGWRAMDQWCRQVQAAGQAAREPDPPAPSPRTTGVRNCWERCTFPTACRDRGPGGGGGGPSSPESEDGGGDIPPEGEPKRRKLGKR